jgi:hypothetical protein
MVLEREGLLDCIGPQRTLERVEPFESHEKCYTI